MSVIGIMGRAKAAAETTGTPLPEAGEPFAYLIQSRVLGDEFVYCTDKKALKKVKAEFPDAAVYFPPEMAELIAFEKTLPRDDWLELVGAVHRLKKRFRGWIVPGGGRHAQAERG